jgi:2-polyprenyl-3-methyl-5-hydroxy-6-metoxy-1,4-benzoquinol methylase
MKNESMVGTIHCWVCGSTDMSLVKKSNISGEISSTTFSITDNHYGTTHDIYKCHQCGFLQCPNMNDVTGYYEELVDEAYDNGREERSIQFKKIIEKILPYANGKKLLDIGAGSGMLVEQAQKMGFDAEGIEPSEWLQSKAVEYNLPVYLGTFPNPHCQGPYDVITLIDVIEHIVDPTQLLQELFNNLTEDGILIVTTPDVNALVPRILKWKWWHFRVAHVGYFSRETLDMMLKKANFISYRKFRPYWYFSFDYLLQRVLYYFPKKLQFKTEGFLHKLTIPLNLGDSIMAIYKKKS